MEVKKVTLQGPVIRIFRWQVDVLDAVRCKRVASFRRPAIIDNRNKRVNAYHQIQVNFIKFCNLCHDHITHAGTLWDLTYIELWAKVMHEVQK